jgi:hypothetical protein
MTCLAHTLHENCKMIFHECSRANLAPYWDQESFILWHVHEHHQVMPLEFRLNSL